MDKLMDKLKDLESERECIERCQMSLREQMVVLGGEDYYNKELIYEKNKEELKEVNKKIEILNNAMDILEGIGV